ncbi:MAB_1171c family putative transporter [Nocardia suismassiliense]|uniref:MAB_1171c family putative transporter n=1 Tax=Nocardia suismassiliense TaxID=2077092 RepID=UPI00131F16DE|nr:MAB_1171c family putative transporter [Nocardia suismassiliense]
MNTNLYSTCAIVGSIALLLRLPAFIRKPEPGTGALCIYFALVTFTFGLSVPAVWKVVDRTLGVPNLAGMIAQCGALTIVFAKLSVVLIWTNSWPDAKRKIRVIIAVLASLLAVMSGLFWIAVPEMTSNPKNFAAASAGITEYSIYLVVYLTGRVVVNIEVGRQCLRYMRRAAPGWLKWSLLTAAIGSVMGLPYAGARLADIFAAHMGVDNKAWEPVAQLSASFGSLITVTGWTMLMWGPAVSETLARLGRYRTYHRLRPLWDALYEILPDIALTSPQRRRITDWPWNITFHLYRRLVEIRDARTTLLPFFDLNFSDAVRTRAEAQGLTGRRLDAVVEAANLAAAIRAKKLSGPGVPASVTIDDYFATHDETGQSLHDERDWLVMVAQAFDRSPMVADAVATLPSPTGP